MGKQSPEQHPSDPTSASKEYLHGIRSSTVTALENVKLLGLGVGAGVGFGTENWGVGTILLAGGIAIGIRSWREARREDNR